MGKLEGKVAVITGGSSGLALETAGAGFVEEGAYVFITGRRQEALDEAVKLIGRNVTGVQGDAANLDDLDRLFYTVKKQKGKIDYPVRECRHGRSRRTGRDYRAAFRQRVRPRLCGGTLFTAQKALPLIKRRRIDHLDWDRLRTVKGFLASACMAEQKAALRSPARTCGSMELKGRNIRVNVLSPGQVDTPDSQRLDKATREMFESLIPRGKMGRPEEIAAAALFLASDDSSYVNGMDLAVDGGFSAV